MAFETEKFAFVRSNEFNLLPQVPGIYAFKSKKAILYIGKAINIKERVKNHINQPVFKDSIFIPQTEKIGFIATGSEIEALILEAELIKKYQPKYNTIWRDGKSHLYVFITKEEFPRVFVGHLSPKIFNFSRYAGSRKTRQFSISKQIGPFVDGKALKQTLRVLRKIFPFRTCKTLPKKPCLYKDLALCSAPCEQKISLRNSDDRRNYAIIGKFKKEYAKNIKNLIAVLKGQKNSVIKNLQKEMHQASQKQDFEKAKSLRDQTWALENVFSHSHIFLQTQLCGPQGSAKLGWQKTEKELRKLLGIKAKIKRTEGYDISNIQGQEATGSMVVFEKSRPNKNEYRKFHVKIEGKPNDTAMIKEVLTRRLKHKEWPLPQVILMDGGKGQLSAGLQLKVQNSKLKVKGIIFMALAKRKNELFLENKKKPILLKNLPQETANLILRVRDEAHRFAITYHKKLRSKNFIQ